MKFTRGWPIKWRVGAAYAAIGFIWGSAWVPTEAVSRQLPLIETGILRFGLAALFLGMLTGAASVRSGCRLLRRSLVRPALLLGVTMLGLPYALTAWAADRVAPGVVPLLYGFMPLLVLLFEGENREPGIPSVVLGIGGVAMIAAPGLSFRWSQAGGVAALLAAVCASGFSLVYVRRLYTRGRLEIRDLLPLSAIQLAVACAFLVLLGACTGQVIPLHLEKAAALPIALLAIVVSGGTQPLVYWLLTRVAAWRLATLQWIASLVALSEAALFLRATPALEAWIGAILIPGCIVWIFLAGNAETSQPVSLQITDDTFSRRRASDNEEKAR
jgi:drug/metabolite transporter (DMT)-like permease